jgi:hypothetical protein
MIGLSSAIAVFVEMRKAARIGRELSDECWWCIQLTGGVIAPGDHVRPGSLEEQDARP